MADFPAITNFTRPGAVNGAEPVDALTNEQLLGLEILKSYQRKIIVSGMVLNKTITNGKTGEFPIMGRATGAYHTAGNRVGTKGIKYAERDISVNRPYIASTFCDDFERAIMHYDTRAELGDALGEALAYVKEIHTMMVLANASKATKVINDADQVDGQYIVNDAFKIDGGTVGSANKAELAAALAEALFEANVLMDMASVPKDERHIVIRPDLYSALVHSVQATGYSPVNSDFGGQGSIATGGIQMLDGTNILNSPHVPSRVYADTEDDFKYYNGDYSKLIGMVFRKEAVGCVNLWTAQVEADYQIEYQGELVLAKQAYGLGTLRPECCIALELDTLTN